MHGDPMSGYPIPSHGHATSDKLMTDNLWNLISLVEAMFNSLIGLCHGQVTWNEWGMDGMVIHAIIPKQRAIYQVPSSKLHASLVL